jgi:hypothetical protein
LPYIGSITTPIYLPYVKGGLCALYTAVIYLFQGSKVGWLGYIKGLKLMAMLI